MAATLNETDVINYDYKPNLRAGMQAGGVIAYPDRIVISKSVAFGDLGSGASDSIDFDSALAEYMITGAYVEVITPAAGEEDLAFILGISSGDTDAFIESTTLHALAAGCHGGVTGARIGSAFNSLTAAVGFTATELDEVTAGEWIFHLVGYPLELSQ